MAAGERDFSSETFLQRVVRGPRGGWSGWAKDLPFQQVRNYMIVTLRSALRSDAPALS